MIEVSHQSFSEEQCAMGDRKNNL